MVGKDKLALDLGSIPSFATVLMCDLGQVTSLLCASVSQFVNQE